MLGCLVLGDGSWERPKVGIAFSDVPSLLGLGSVAGLHHPTPRILPLAGTPTRSP